MYAFVVFISFVLLINGNNDHKEFLEKSELRKGLGPMYSFTNSFIDTIEPKWPSYLYYPNEETINQFYNRLIDFLSNKDYSFYVNESFNILPGLWVFIIFSFAFMLFVPLIGLIYCCINVCCCCKNCSKISHVDAKYDKFKRRVVSALLFAVLVFQLVLIIILFITSSYMTQSTQNFKGTVTNVVESVGDFIDVDVQSFQKNTIENMINAKTTIQNIYNKTKYEYANKAFTNISQTNEFLKRKLDKNLIVPLDSLSEFNTLVDAKIMSDWKQDFDNFYSSASQQVQTDLNGFKTVPTFIKFPEFNQLNDFKNQTLAFYTNGVDWQSFIDDNINAYDQDFNNEVNNAFSTALGYIEDLNNTFKYNIEDYINDIKNDINVLDDVSEYSKYAMNAFFGLSAFMILLLILFIIGFLGVLCHRANIPSRSIANAELYRHTCHRGIAANFLLSGVGVFLILSFFLMFITFLVFSAGIISNIFACRPLIQLDDNELVKITKNFKDVKDLIGDLSLKNLLNDCRSKTPLLKSTEVKNLIKHLSKFNIDTYTNIDFYDTEIRDTLNNLYENFELDLDIGQLNVPKLNDTLNSFNYLTNLNQLDLNTVLTNIDDAKNQSQHVLNYINSNSDTSPEAEQLKSIGNNYTVNLELMNQKALNLEKLQANLSSIVDELQFGFDSILNKIYIGNSAIQILKETNDQSTLPSLIEILNNTLEYEISIIPTCEIVSSIYDKTTLTTCYEFIDNYNVYWLSIWLLLLIFIPVSILALILARLFKKYYEYDDSESINYNDDDLNSKKARHKSNEIPLTSLTVSF